MENESPYVPRSRIQPNSAPPTPARRQWQSADISAIYPLRSDAPMNSPFKTAGCPIHDSSSCWHEWVITPQLHAASCVSYFQFAGISPDATSRQDRLSGVIICPAVRE